MLLKINFEDKIEIYDIGVVSDDTFELIFDKFKNDFISTHIKFEEREGNKYWVLYSKKLKEFSKHLCDGITKDQLIKEVKDGALCFLPFSIKEFELKLEKENIYFKKLDVSDKVFYSH